MCMYLDIHMSIYVCTYNKYETCNWNGICNNEIKGMISYLGWIVVEEDGRLKITSGARSAWELCYGDEEE